MSLYGLQYMCISWLAYAPVHIPITTYIFLEKTILLVEYQCTMTCRKPGDGITGKKTVRTEVMLQQQSCGDKLHSS